MELLSKTGEEDEEGSHNDADVEEVIQKLQSIYGQGAETKCYEDLLKMKPVIKIPTLRRIPLKGMSVSVFIPFRARNGQGWIKMGCNGSAAPLPPFGRNQSTGTKVPKVCQNPHSPSMLKDTPSPSSPSTVPGLGDTSKPLQPHCSATVAVPS